MARKGFSSWQKRSKTRQEEYDETNGEGADQLLMLKDNKKINLLRGDVTRTLCLLTISRTMLTVHVYHLLFVMSTYRYIFTRGVVSEYILEHRNGF